MDNSVLHIIFVSVFHRILDFKAGLDFYLGPFFLHFHDCLDNSRQFFFLLQHNISILISNNNIFSSQVIEYGPNLLFFLPAEFFFNIIYS